MLIAAIVRENVHFLRSQHLAEARDPYLWSQSTVAHRLRLSRPAYINLEAGERGISAQDLVNLAAVYDVTPQRLMTPVIGSGSISLTGGRSVDGEAFVLWLRGGAPLPGQDPDFFASHEREQTPAGVAVADGRRSLASEIPAGLQPDAEVLDAERALAALLRYAGDPAQADSMEVHWDHLSAAVGAAGERRMRQQQEGTL